MMKYIRIYLPTEESRYVLIVELLVYFWKCNQMELFDKKDWSTGIDLIKNCALLIRAHLV